jgi:uncharacterized protein with GYD domain
MSKYLIIASYTSEGIKGIKDAGGTARTKAVQQTVESLGGTLESFYFAFGEADAFVTVDLPDNVAAAAIGLAVASTGLVATRTVVLLTPSEIDDAGKRKVGYTPPGK